MSISNTLEQRKVIHKYYAYKVFTNLWFLGAVWLYFYRIFITDQQVGILDGLAFAIGLVAEVPSGALADRFGRDKMVKIGQILAGTGLIVQGLGSDFFQFFIGQTMMMVGISFVSGADQALFFEKLNFDKKSTEWRKLVTRGSQIALVGTLFAVVVGGWLHTINPRIPWLITGVSLISSVIIIWPLVECRERERKHQKVFEEIKEYLVDIKVGFSQFATPKLWLYVPLIVAVQGLFYATGWGLFRLVLLDRFYFDPFLGSVAIASCQLITVGILGLMYKHADSISEKKFLTFISLSSVFVLLLSVFDIGLWGYVVILVLYAGEHTLHPFMSEILNYRTSNTHRATVLSVSTFLRAVPYIALAPIIGYLNTHNSLEIFLIAWSAVVVAALVIFLILRKRDTKLDLTT